MNQKAIVLNHECEQYISLEDVSKEYLKQLLDKINKAIKLEKYFTDAWLTKARLHLRLDEKKEAIEAFQRVLILAPNHTEAMRNLIILGVSTYKFHAFIVNLSSKLGYAKSNGYCQGFSAQWLGYALSNQLDSFHQLILILLEKGHHFADDLTKAKAKKGEGLNEDDKRLFDLLALYEGIILYHSPRLFHSLFHNQHFFSQQHLDKTSIVAASSDFIHKQGGLLRLHVESLAYDQLELSSYFKKLDECLKNITPPLTQPVGFHLINYDHGVALAYYPNKGWFFMDINQYPVKSLGFEETGKLAEFILEGFDGNHYGLFNIFSYTTNASLESKRLKTALEQFKTKQQLPNYVELREENKINLAYTAAYSGNLVTLKALSKIKGFDFNKATDDHGAFPAFIAAQHGHADALVTLAKIKGVDFTKVTNDGATPAFVASEYGHVAVLEALAKVHGVDFNKARNDGVSPTYIAAQNGHVAVLEFFAKTKGVDFNKATNDGKTPALIVTYQGHLDSLIVLVKNGADLDKTYTCTPYLLLGIIPRVDKKVIERANTFINNNLNVKTGTITLTPGDMADILGHEEISKFITQSKNNIFLSR